MADDAPPQGWFADPSDASGATERYWDGASWTEATRVIPASQALVPVETSWGVHGADAMPYGTGEEVLLVIGEISCTATSVISPSGTFPIKGTEWMIQDGSSKTRRIPPYAIVLAIVFFLACLLGLLFLLIQEDVYSGSVNVTVKDGEGHYFMTSIPVQDAATVSAVRDQVNYARYLSGI